MTLSPVAGTNWLMEVLRHVLPHWAAGCIAGVVAAFGIVATNLGSLCDLILHADDGWLAFALLTFGLVVTFASAAIGGAIMALGRDGD